MGAVRKEEREPRLAYSVDEAAALLGVGRSSLDKWINMGRVASVKLGDRRLIARRTLDALLAGTTGPEASGKCCRQVTPRRCGAAL